MDSNLNEDIDDQFQGRTTIEHSKRIQLGMAGASLAMVLALLTFEQNYFVMFAICCFAVSLPLSTVFAAKFEVDDPRIWFISSNYSKFLYCFNLVIFVLGIAVVFASGSIIYLAVLILSIILAALLWVKRPQTTPDISEFETDSTTSLNE